MYRLYKDPTGENVNAEKSGDTSVEVGRRGTLKVISENERIAALEHRLQVLQAQLDDKKVRHKLIPFPLLPFTIVAFLYTLLFIISSFEEYTIRR